MKKLYDEIIALEITKGSDGYIQGFNNALEETAELAKKYDDEIERLRVENKYLIEALEQIEAKVAIIDKLIK
jgi:hypothetical protein